MGLEDELARRYLHLRRALIVFFGRHGCDSPEDLADETIFRVVLSIRKGEKIRNLGAWVLGIAKNVLLEDARRCKGEQELAVVLPLPAPSPVDEALGQRLEVVKQRLPDEEREMLEGYHGGEARGLIGRRRALARKLGITLGALKIRVFRIRRKLLEMLTEPGDEQKEGETHSTTVHI